MPLPLIKLASLLVKQFSKRLSNRVKERAKHSPFFRKVCINAAEFYHGYEINFNLRRLGFAKTTKKQPMNPERAVELGAEMISEGFLYTFLVTVLLTEITLSSMSDNKKKQIEQDNKDLLLSKIDEQSFAMATLEAEVRQLQRTVGELDTSKYELMEKIKSLEQKKK